MSIIDSLGEGLSVVSKKIWLATIPILLDLFLWLGPKMSMAPVFEKTVDNLRALTAQAAGEVATPDLLAGFEGTMDLMQETVGNTNLLSLLAWGRLGVPSVAGLQPIPADAGQVVYISGYGELFMWQIIILALGLWVACLFLGILAQVARGESANLGAAVSLASTHWLYLAAIFVPLGILLVMASSIGILLGPLALFLFGGLIWLMVYLTFFPHAVVMAHETPFHAVMNSFSVVRAYFWPTLGILVLTNVLNTGLGLVWSRLMGISPILSVIAIVANGIIGTGLALAMFIFYRNHIAMLIEQKIQQRSA